MPARKSTSPKPEKNKSLDPWVWGNHLRREQRARRVRQRRELPDQYVAETRAMANMNMIIHDMEGQIEIGDTFKNPKFRDKRGKLLAYAQEEGMDIGDWKLGKRVGISG